MSENKRFTVDYDITTGNYDIHDKKVGNGVDGYIAYLSDEKRANNLCNKLNGQSELIKRLKTIREEQTKTILKQKRKIKELEKENEKLKGYNKSQELEIVRLHNLADAMSGVLKELGVYDVYDEEQINSVKEKLK